MQRVLLIGSSGHARVVIDIFERQTDAVIVGLIDDFRNVGESTLEYSVLGGEKDIPAVVGRHDVSHLFIAVGDNAARAAIAQRLGNTSNGASFATAIHPSANIGRSTTIGEGSSVMAGAVVGPASIVGRHCIVNSAASLDHDSIMADFASMAPGVCAGGGCTIGEFASISIGATISHNITIGADAVIGAAALVISDIPPFSVSYGVPARHIRFRKHGDKYL